MPQPDLDQIFTYHAPFGDQAERYGSLRTAAKNYAIALTGPSRTRDSIVVAYNVYYQMLMDLAPTSAELEEAWKAASDAMSLAIDSLTIQEQVVRKVQSASMFANAAIAINEVKPEQQCLANYGE